MTVPSAPNSPTKEWNMILLSTSSSFSNPRNSQGRALFLWTMLFTMGCWMFMMVHNNNRAYDCAMSRREMETIQQSPDDRLTINNNPEEEEGEAFYHSSTEGSDDDGETIEASISVSASVIQHDNNDDDDEDCFIEFDTTKVPHDMGLCFWAGKVNFGDTLGPAIVKRLLERHFGGKCSASALPTSTAMAACLPVDEYDRHACFLSIGSIIQCTRPGDVIWGAGVNLKHFEKGSFGDDTVMNYTLAAVRGPRTETYLRKEHPHAFPNGDPDAHPQGSLPYGDPGFLVPTLFPSICRPMQDTFNNDRENICFVPHYKELAPIRKRLNAIGNSTRKTFDIISPEQDWTMVVPQLCKCTHIVSQSLHGLVIADAMGIPNIWYKSKEHEFKYHDYYRGAFGDDYVKKNVKTYDYADDLRALLTNTTGKYSLYSKPVPQQQRQELAQSIIDSFPVHLFRTRTSPKGSMASSMAEQR